MIHVSNSKTIVRCPHCKRYTRSIPDYLKPVKIKYLKMAEYTTYLVVYKRRFNCNKCLKRFTESNYINGVKKTLSNKLIQKILLDLREYNLSLNYIAINNNVTDNTVRNILKESMKTYPKRLRLLPSIISFDEFKADTNKGKYPFVINDILHKEVLDILLSRKKRRSN